MPTIALTSKTPKPTVSTENGLILLVIETTKDYKDGVMSFMPIVDLVSVASTSDQKATNYLVPLEVVACDNKVVTHLISLSLPSGEYKVELMSGYGLPCGDVDGFLRNPHGNFSFPMSISFSSSASKVIYAGHIKAHMRHRNSETEPHAASAIPLLEQQLAGFYPTTFDITITDEFENDISRFSAKFPALRKDDIGKSLSVRSVR